MFRNDRPTRILVLLFAAALALAPSTGFAKKKKDSPPVVIEWVDHPVCLFPLDARIVYKTVSGTERIRPLEATADSAFAADMPGLLKEEGLDWTMPGESALEANKEAMPVLMQVREELTALAHDLAETQEELETAAAEGYFLTRSGVEELRAAVAKRLSKDVQAELVAYLADFTDRQWAFIPVYDGMKKDAGEATSTVTKNLLKMAAKGAINSALGARNSSEGSTPLEDLGEMNLGVYALDMKTGEFASYNVLAVTGPIGIGAGSEKFNKDISKYFVRGILGLKKQVEKHNKAAKKKLEKLEKNGR